MSEHLPAEREWDMQVGDDLVGSIRFRYANHTLHNELPGQIAVSIFGTPSKLND